jgi:hypothetical protein
MRNVYFSLMLAIALLGTQMVHAVKMDHKTHDELINRLEDTLASMAKNASERSPVMFRLAGLYADRARLKEMEEVERKCSNCLKAKEDRQKAVQYYEVTLKDQSKEKQGEVLIQLAHLESLNSKDKKSQKLFHQILNAGTKVYSSRVVGLAHLNIAEDFFRKADFKTALKHYEKAQAYDLPDPALPRYRAAWCELNLGHEKQAISGIKNILKNPEMVKDVSFHEDASNDLATLLPRAYVGNEQIQELLSLSPESKRKENLKTLAEECSRLGKKGSAILALQAYSKEPGFSSTEQIETQIQIAQLQFDMGKTDLAQKEYRDALNLWKQLGCRKDEACKDIKIRYRNFVTSWNKLKKSRPDQNLLQAYEDYLSVFSDDLEMTHWAALTARTLNDAPKGVALFRRAAALAKEQRNAKMFEGSLLGEIELAEKSKNKDLMEAAYTHYINENPQGDKIWETRFARAALWAAQKKYQQAFSEYHNIVTADAKAAKKYQSSAADAALDQLARLNDHAALQARSQEYAKILPQKSSQYLKVARKAVLNQVPVLASGSLKQALDKLEQYPQAGASKDELVKFHKNRILLSQQLKDVARAEKAAWDLYKVKGLSSDDNAYAIGVIAWAAELKLDFKTAFLYQKKLTPKRPSADDELKLAVLAELAGLNSYNYYSSYLKKERGLKARNAVRANLVKNSSHPWKELSKHLKDLKSSPDILAAVALDAYSRQPSDSQIRKLLKTTRIARYPEGKTLERQFTLRELKKFDREIGKHRLNSRNDRLLQASIKKRLQLLHTADVKVKQSLRAKDWSLQVITLAINARENERLQKDLLALPPPRGLNKTQLAQYKKLLFDQSEVYRRKAANISEDINALMERDKDLDGLTLALENASHPVRKVLEKELTLARDLTRGNAKNRLSQLLKLPSRQPSFQEVTVARNAVREDPFDLSKTARLKELEAQRGEETMVGYLDARMSAMKKGAKL